MMEIEALGWLKARYPDRLDVLRLFVELVRQEMAVQNLISSSTELEIWSRHVVDSAQLIEHVSSDARSWLDVGTGAGFPGMIAAILGTVNVTLCEPRKLRVDFLRRCVEQLGLMNATVFHGKAQHIFDVTFDVISARAVMPLDKMFSATSHLAGTGTRYILPRGSAAWSDLDIVKRSWHGMFHVERSVVDENSGIVLAEKVKRK